MLDGKEHVDDRGERDVGSVGDAAGPFDATDGDGAEADESADDGAEHEGEDGGLPAEESTDGSHELDVTETHGFAGQDEFAGDDLHVGDLLGIEGFVADGELGRFEGDGDVPVAAVALFGTFGEADLRGFGVESDVVALAIKDFFVGKFLFGKLERGFREGDFGVGSEFDLFLAESHFAGAKDEIDEAAADGDAPKAGLEGCRTAESAVELGDEGGEKETGDNAADGDFVGNDKVLDIDESGDDKGGEDKAVGEGECDGARGNQGPGGGESEAGESFDKEIANGDGFAAVFAFSAEGEPGDDGDVQYHGDGVTAFGAMGPRMNDTEVAWHAVDADIEEAADHGAENEEDDDPERRRDSGPILGIEDVVKNIH